MAPGGPSILIDPSMSPEDAALMKRLMGLDQPFIVQYGHWLNGILRGDFGTSLSVRLPVAGIIAQQLPNTLLLAACSLVAAVLLSVPLGVMSARRRNSPFDHATAMFSFFGLSVPPFWFGLILVIVFAIKLPWLPAGGMVSEGGGGFLDVARHLVLPTLVLAVANMAELVRYTRSAMITVLKEDFIRTARAKGVNERVTIYKHALANALIPVVTVIGLLIPRLFGGAAITETVFGWPGMGQLAVRAAFERDYPVIMAVTLVTSAIVIIASFIVDVLYAWIDPRISLE
ncbi:Binding-protein-dependent transport systems inner membrane component [Sodalis praecaptivus]|uniref:Binding-protein-dependent transport systems inner membrane component n=2 Tax=Bruguierivoracaceae TaxID=2812006 RepID=W0I3E6_9GAMM|nr:Binding-protein-dependent transport systems inner membrane component [Sodalis praecaptivus]